MRSASNTMDVTQCYRQTKTRTGTRTRVCRETRRRNVWQTEDKKMAAAIKMHLL